MSYRVLNACAGLNESEFLSLYSPQSMILKDINLSGQSYFLLCMILTLGNALFDRIICRTSLRTYILIGKPEGNDDLEDIGIYGRIILKRTLKIVWEFGD
jgi:hypothetical protein